MSDKILLIPPTTNQCQWPQNNQTDESKLIMEKQSQELQQQAVLKCPRCESSNTKFCYYNNYSLSQPRHFCKACKRYWTRGGTLRNVPVGGGYRRNKRSTTTTTLIKTPTTSSSAPSSTTSNLNISPMFYGLSSSNNNNSCDMNLPFSRFNNFLQPEMNSVGLGFSSDNGYTNGFNTIFSSSASNDSSVVMPSLLSNTLLQHKFMNDGVKYGSDAGSNNNFQGLEKKVEGQNSKLEWNGSACQNQMEYGGGALYDPSSLYWNSAASSGIGVWNDQGSNIGSSVTSLI